MTIFPQLIQLIFIHKRTLQNKLVRAQMSMFQTVCSYPLLQQVIMEVRCILRQLHIFLLSQPLSSLARQAVVMEVEFTLTAVKVFYILYVVIIVAQHTLLRIVSLRTYK